MFWNTQSDLRASPRHMNHIHVGLKISPVESAVYTWLNTLHSLRIGAELAML